MNKIVIGLLLVLSFCCESSFAQTSDSAYVVLGIDPSFPGGEAAMLKFLANTIRYPRHITDQGVVYTEFVVNRDGSISNIKTLKGVSPAMDKEVIRAIKLMPKWNPGKLKNGEVVRALFTLPVQFESFEEDPKRPSRKERRASRKAARKLKK